MRVIDVDTCSCQLYIFLGTSSSLFLSDHSKNLRVENISSGDLLEIIFCLSALGTKFLLKFDLQSSKVKHTLQFNCLSVSNI